MKVDRIDLSVFFWLITLSIGCMILATPFLWGEPQLFVNWLSIPIYGSLGFIGMKYFLRRSGFKGMMDNQEGKSKYLIPIAAGIIFAGAAIVFDLFSTDKVPQLTFPVSILAYMPVAILDNMFWKLFFLTMIVFLISGKWMKGKGEEGVFWSISVIYAFLYILIQFGQYSKLVGEVTTLTVVQILLVSGGFIITSCCIFRRHGFLAPVLMHITQYMIYHGLYGGLY